ncbi:TPR repeat-containing protein YrrB [Ferriphaselus amnicola]|uniref:protein O-GlcNAc transferase n=1 Tax=Ferriphaselus amnicola TaxID=1188319 RepID=A0A2Z6G8Z0_9PROT|nr:tetratricopeptide repeat protein [Ferriphaselus amnicola]BBE49946.1 TPR repeat-containing protein YrrB [Ferriphaselus amnicola]
MMPALPSTPTTQRNDPCPCGSGKKFKHCCISKQTLQPANNTDLITLFQLAVRSFERGQLDQAATEFRKILEVKKTHADAIHYLGLIDYQQGKTDSGIALLVRSLTLDPENASFLSNLGAAYNETGRFKEAIPVLRKAIHRNPEYANAHSNLGMALQHAGEFDSAISSYRRAIALTPNHANALYNLGVLLFSQDQFSEAIITLLKVVELVPQHADCIFHLGLLSDKMGDPSNAIDLISHAISLASNQPIYHLNLALIYDKKGMPERTIEHMKLAAALPIPHTATILGEIGLLYAKLGRFSEALSYAKEALTLNSELLSGHLALGLTNYATGHEEEAIAHYQIATKLAPNNATIQSDLLFFLLRSRKIDDQALFNAHLEFARTFEQPLKKLWKKQSNSTSSDRKLKIGYVSADFCDHSVAMFIRPILAHHDRHDFTVYCYYNHTRQDAVSQELKSYADHWRPCLQLSDDELFAQIQRDEIDILIDLSGHTALNRLLVFARKPAPIQITWLGYAGTTGLSSMDYRFTDQYLDPPGMTDQFHSEQLIRLSASYTFGLHFQPPEVTPLPALSGQAFTFSCLNAHSKISDENIALWAEILKRTPGSRIMFGNSEEEAVQHRLINTFASYGIDASRLILKPRVTTYDFLALHQSIDVALDPFPYNGGTTTVLATLMGVPVITLSGSRTVSRCGAGIMGAVGLSDWVATSPDQYVSIAIKYFHDLEALSRIRQSLRDRWHQSSVGNPAAYTQEIESTYRQLWSHWCSQQTQKAPEK